MLRTHARRCGVQTADASRRSLSTAASIGDMPATDRLPRTGQVPAMRPASRGRPEPIAGAARLVAVSSAKGGVGKSTVAVNLALAQVLRGRRTGILDLDLHGPSLPRLLKLAGEPRLSKDGRLVPLQNYGLAAMSMGFLIRPDRPLAWRGLMLQKAMNQLLHQVEWPELDLLLLDLPPGTGDVVLTLAQQCRLDGALVVSTPQDLARIDAVRGKALFDLVHVPVLGMVLNMAGITCPSCGFTHDVFPSGTVDLDIPMLGRIPLNAAICKDADEGIPTVVRDPKGPLAAAYFALADALWHALENK